MVDYDTVVEFIRSTGHSAEGHLNQRMMYVTLRREDAAGLEDLLMTEFPSLIVEVEYFSTKDPMCTIAVRLPGAPSYHPEHFSIKPSNLAYLKPYIQRQMKGERNVFSK